VALDRRVQVLQIGIVDGLALGHRDEGAELRLRRGERGDEATDCAAEVGMVLCTRGVVVAEDDAVLVLAALFRRSGEHGRVGPMAEGPRVHGWLEVLVSVQKGRSARGDDVCYHPWVGKEPVEGRGKGAASGHAQVGGREAPCAKRHDQQRCVAAGQEASASSEQPEVGRCSGRRQQEGRAEEQSAARPH